MIILRGAIDNSPSLAYSISSSEEDGEVDEVIISELECDRCGYSVEATCPDHGEQEVAAVRGSRLRCTEWDYSQGEACSLPLEVVCNACGNEEVEI